MSCDLRCNVRSKHVVNLVYASAMSLDEASTTGPLCEAWLFLRRVAHYILAAQYYGALKHAARRTSGVTKRAVYMMNPGKADFNNPVVLVAEAMSAAVELLTDVERSKLDIKVLCDSGSSDFDEFKSALDGFNKFYRETRVD